MPSHRSQLFCHLCHFLNAWYPNSLCMVSIATHLPASSIGCRRQQDTQGLSTLIIIQRERYSMALLGQNNVREEVLKTNSVVLFSSTTALQIPLGNLCEHRLDTLCHICVVCSHGLHFTVQGFFSQHPFRGQKKAILPYSEKRRKGLLSTRSEGSHASFLPFCPVFTNANVGFICSLLKETANRSGSRACSQRKLAGEAAWARLWKCCRHSGTAVCLPHRSSSALSCKWSSQCLPVLCLLPDKPAPSARFLLDIQVLVTLPCKWGVWVPGNPSGYKEESTSLWTDSSGTDRWAVLSHVRNLHGSSPARTHWTLWLDIRDKQKDEHCFIMRVLTSL